MHKGYTVVREEDYCDFDGSRIVSGLKCLALVDIQEETEFPETLCVCGSVRLRLWYVRRDFVARDFWRKDVFSVSLSVTSRDVYDSVVKVTLEDMEQYGVYMFYIEI